MTKPNIQCLDCGHVGPVVKKNGSVFGGCTELFVFVVLLMCGIIPGLLYLMIIASRSKERRDKRYCSKCGSSAIALKDP